MASFFLTETTVRFYFPDPICQARDSDPDLDFNWFPGLERYFLIIFRAAAAQNPLRTDVRQCGELEPIL